MPLTITSIDERAEQSIVQEFKRMLIWWESLFHFREVQGCSSGR
jgi:hypothetical protein